MMGNYSYVVDNDGDTVGLTIENTDRCDGPVSIGLFPVHAINLAVQLLRNAEQTMRGENK